MALIVLDASVMIAHRERDDAHHVAATAALRSHLDEEIVLPASAYSEILVGPARQGRLKEVREQVVDMALRVEPISAAIAERAATLRAMRRSLRLPDALVLATADELGATSVLTTDARWSGLPHVRVVR